MRFLQLISVVTAVWFMACAIEVGNPNGDKDKGTVKIQIASEDSDSGTANLVGSKSFLMAIEEVKIYGYGTSSEISATLKPKSDSVEIFSSAGPALIAEDNIVAGNYETIVIVLAEKDPFRYRPADTDEFHPVKFRDPDYRSIFISQSFEVTDGSEEEIIIDLDVGRSLEQGSGGFIFRPKMRPHRKKMAVKYSGQLERDDGDVVCAYLYNALKPPKRPRPGSFPGGGTPPPPPPGELGEPPPSFASQADVILDEDSSCPNAFAIVRVRDEGRYKFPRLRPGSYIFRAFYTGAEVETVAEGVTLSPPNLDLIRRYRNRDHLIDAESWD